MTPPTPEAALRKALFDADTERLLELGQYQEAAAAILDALPPDWCGHLSRFEDLTLEVARLRAALEHIQQWHLGRNFVCRTARATW